MRASVDHASLSDRHLRFERRFPSRSFDGGSPLGDPAPWHAGDSYVPDLVGWVMSLIVSPGDTALVQGKLHLRTAWKEPAEYGVSGFAAGAGGRVFIPWPALELEIFDANGANANPSSAVVSFAPVFRDDPRPPGIGTVLFGRSFGTVGATEVDIAVPAGATEYRVMPRGDIANVATVRERSAGTEEATYRLGPVTTTAVVPGTETGAGAWRPTPAGPAPQIRVSGTTKDTFTVFWRYELGTVR